MKGNHWTHKLEKVRAVKVTANIGFKYCNLIEEKRNLKKKSVHRNRAEYMWGILRQVLFTALHWHFCAWVTS